MNKKTVRILVPAIFGLALVCLWLTTIQPARADTITVDTPSDELDYDCSVSNCSLRDAGAFILDVRQPEE